tara:strand:- start:199 stop:444 length:246 start_codon:yes stop_codon:yes gene_type:complete
MLHREDQIHEEVKKYDIVRSKIYARVVAGRMNSYNKTINHKDFEGYALVTGRSDTFAEIYLPNRTRKLLKISNLIVVSKWK